MTLELLYKLADYLPNGIDFLPSRQSTGRFTNGRTVVDIIGQELGLQKFMPPYLAPSTVGPVVLNGVNYASGGGGILNATGKIFGGRINLNVQIDNYANTRQDIISSLGMPSALGLLRTSLFSVTIGSNDFLDNYLTPVLSAPQRATTPPEMLIDALISNYELQLTVILRSKALSASIDSSSKAGVKISEFNFEAVEGLPKGLDKSKALGRVDDTGTSPVVAAKGGLGEPLIGLKLGKRTYFEDVCAGNSKNSSSSTSLVPSTTVVKKTRVSNQSVPNSRCQVEGCNIDLSLSKDYHRKHRVCESHSKSPMVVVAGQELRFCQQCSRFHDLSEFDQKKRSCRRRLSDHNARRRKPQSDTISFNSSRLASPFYDDRQQMNFLLNRAPFGHMRPTSSSICKDSCGFSLTHSKGSWIKSTKSGGLDGQLHFSNSELSNTVPTLPHDLDKLLPFKGTTAKVLSQGLEIPIPAPNMDGAPDLRHALSLLSTDSWGSVSPRHSNLAHFVNTSHNSAAQPAMQAVNTTSAYWQDQQTLPQHERVLPFDFHNNASQYQGFLLPKSPYETSFFDSGAILSKPDGRFLEFRT